MVCKAFVAGGRRSGAGQQAMRPGRIACCPRAPDDGQISGRNMLSRL